LLPLLSLTLAACGGGDADQAAIESDSASDPASVAAADVDGKRETALAVTDPRVAAATATANSTSNVCASIRPFYWEIGNRDARQASGSVKNPKLTTQYSASTPMALASASKWLYGAYVVERKAGQLDASDVELLTMRSGYASFDECQQKQTVQSCLDSGSNGLHTAAWDNSFYYNGGHMQKHASLNGLGALGNVGLAAAVRGQIGKDIALAYARPQPAGGAVASPDAYAKFLRKLMKGDLRLGNQLGSQAACTSPLLCAPGQATYSPAENLGNLHYSIGHWVEDQAGGDGAFSSGGAYGFYPWIDATRTSYGIVARSVPDGGRPSLLCGQLIRKAWATGSVQ
jgi:hypothetical protein